MNISRHLASLKIGECRIFSELSTSSIKYSHIMHFSSSNSVNKGELIGDQKNNKGAGALIKECALIR